MKKTDTYEYTHRGWTICAGAWRGYDLYNPDRERQMTHRTLDNARRYINAVELERQEASK